MKSREWKMALWGADWKSVNDPDASAQGMCRFEEGDGVTLDIPLGNISSEPQIRIGAITCAQAGVRETPERLVGMTQDGIRIVLRDVSSLGVGLNDSGTSKETLVARTAYASKFAFDDSKPIVATELEFRGLSQWLDCELCVPKKDGAYIVRDERMTGQFPLFQDEHVSASIQYGRTRPRLWKDAFETRSFANVRVDCTEGMSLEKLWHDVVWPVQASFAFLFGFYPAIDIMNVWFMGEGGSAAVYQQSYMSKNQRLIITRVPVRFDALGEEGLSDFASRWFCLKENERRAAEILTTLLGGWTMPLELPLTAASTMMDALGRAGEKKPYSKKEFCQLKEPILNATPEPLRDRVEAILGQLNSHSYSERLDAIFEECGEYGKALIEDWDGFKRVQRDLRNKGAHALDGKEDVSVQVDHYYALVLLAYRVLLKRLDASEATMKSFCDSRFLIGARERIRLRYSMSKNGS